MWDWFTVCVLTYPPEKALPLLLSVSSSGSPTRVQSIQSWLQGHLSRHMKHSGLAALRCPGGSPHSPVLGSYKQLRVSRSGEHSQAVSQSASWSSASSSTRERAPGWGASADSLLDSTPCPWTSRLWNVSLSFESLPRPQQAFWADSPLLPPTA